MAYYQTISVTALLGNSSVLLIGHSFKTPNPIAFRGQNLGVWPWLSTHQAKTKMDVRIRRVLFCLHLPVTSRGMEYVSLNRVECPVPTGGYGALLINTATGPLAFSFRVSEVGIRDPL